MVAFEEAAEVVGADGLIPFLDLFEGRHERLVHKHRWSRASQGPWSAAMGPLLYLAMSATTSEGAGVPLPSWYSSVPVRSAGGALGVDLYVAGQFGELTRYVPFDLVDAVLKESGRLQRRLPLVPSRVGIYFLLVLGLFPGLLHHRAPQDPVA